MTQTTAVVLSPALSPETLGSAHPWLRAREDLDTSILGRKKFPNLLLATPKK